METQFRDVVLPIESIAAVAPPLRDNDNLALIYKLAAARLGSHALVLVLSLARLKSIERVYSSSRREQLSRSLAAYFPILLGPF